MKSILVRAYLPLCTPDFFVPSWHLKEEFMLHRRSYRSERPLADNRQVHSRLREKSPAQNLERSSSPPLTFKRLRIAVA